MTGVSQGLTERGDGRSDEAKKGGGAARAERVPLH